MPRSGSSLDDADRIEIELSAAGEAPRVPVAREPAASDRGATPAPAPPPRYGRTPAARVALGTCAVAAFVAIVAVTAVITRRAGGEPTSAPAGALTVTAGDGPLSITAYPAAGASADGSFDAEAGTYDLALALALLASDEPRLTATELDDGATSSIARATLDARNDRAGVTLSLLDGDDFESLLADWVAELATSELWVRRPGTTWRRSPGGNSMQFIDAYLRGWVGPDVLADLDHVPHPALVRLPDGRPARVISFEAPRPDDVAGASIEALVRDASEVQVELLVTGDNKPAELHVRLGLPGDVSPTGADTVVSIAQSFEWPQTSPAVALPADTE